MQIQHETVQSVRSQRSLAQHDASRCTWLVLALGLLALLAGGCGGANDTSGDGTESDSSATAEASNAADADESASGDSEAEEDANDEDAKPQQKEKAIKVDAGEVRRGELIIPVYADGVIRTPRSVEIRTKLAGELVQVLVADGQEVKQGQLLARIDERPYRLDLEENRYRHFQALSQVAAEADTFTINHEALSLFSQQRKELEKLYTKGNLTREEYQARLLELELAALQQGAFRQDVFEQRTGLAEARVGAERAKLNLENTEIRAPFAGVVQGLVVVPGEIVSVGTPICSIFNNDRLEAVVNVLRCDRITQGPKVSDFESALARICNAKFAVAVKSGTSALHIACLAAGIGPGDEVITSLITFVASANCAVYCGARPVFADIDPRTYNISPLEIEKRLTSKTRAIIPVHFAGQSCDMITIRTIIKKTESKYGHKIFLIEDASHALGSNYSHDPVGSCRYSDMVVTSFHPVKHITTGEGGAIMTANDELYWKLNRLRSHGITSTPSEIIYKDSGFAQTDSSEIPVINPWYYEQQLLGFNYRITDIQCALGLSQLKKIDAFRKRRKEIVVLYNEAFQDVNDITIPFEADGCESNFHLYVLLFDFEQIGINRADFMRKLKDQGIQTQVHYIPVHTQPYYQKNFNYKWSDFPKAEDYYKKCLSIPIFPAMTNHDVNYVTATITKVFT